LKDIETFNFTEKPFNHFQIRPANTQQQNKNNRSITFKERNKKKESKQIYMKRNENETSKFFSSLKYR
jgi:hypothetical protein